MRLSPPQTVVFVVGLVAVCVAPFTARHLAELNSRPDLSNVEGYLSHVSDRYGPAEAGVRRKMAERMRKMGKDEQSIMTYLYSVPGPTSPFRPR